MVQAKRRKISMTELQLRQAFVNAAKSYLGWSEINGQDDLIIDRYNAIRTPRYKMNHQDSWCAAFVSVVKHEAGLDSIIPTECGCEEMLRLFRNVGRYQEDGTITPQIGDVIFYNWKAKKQPNNGWAQHVGIVTYVSNGLITVIEGNASDRVKYRTISVGDATIRGYGLPDYASLCKNEPVAPVQPVPTPQPVPSTPPAERYQIGKVYVVAVNQLRVRTGAGTIHTVKSRKGLTPDGQKHADQQGRLCSGTAVQCLEIRNVRNDIWMRIPSGWIAAKYNGTEYVR